MSWSPISLLVPQYQKALDNTPYSGAVLKAYKTGTTTNISMATDVGGGTTFTSVALNSDGVPEHSGSVIIPFVDQNYKIALYFTQADADADTTANAIFVIDGLSPIAVSGAFSVDDAVTSGVTAVISVTHTTTGTPATGIGSGIDFITETADDNNETGMQVQSVSTNVGAGTEAFDFVLNLMKAGATAAEAFRVTSAGVMKLFGQSQWLKGADVASATALPVLTDGNYFDVTGTTTVTSIDTTKAGTVIKLHFDGALILTHHATNLVLPTGANITTAAGDEAEFVEYATGTYRCTSYTRASGESLVTSVVNDTTPQLGGALDGQDNTVSKINLLDYGEVTNAIGSTGGGTQDIDLTLGNSVSATVDTSTNTFTFSNPTASDELCGFTLLLTNGGSQTVNWPASVDWPAGLAPTLTSSGVDKLVFETVDGGTTWYGNLVALAYA